MALATGMGKVEKCMSGRSEGGVALGLGACGENELNSGYPGVAQLLARVVWDHQAAGSNPVTRTKVDF